MLVSSREGLPELYVTLHAQPGVGDEALVEDRGRWKNSLTPASSVCVCARPCARACVRACVRA